MLQKINAMMSKFELMVITEMRDKDHIRDLQMTAARKVLEKKMFANIEEGMENWDENKGEKGRGNKKFK